METRPSYDVTPPHPQGESQTVLSVLPTASGGPEVPQYQPLPAIPASTQYYQPQPFHTSASGVVQPYPNNQPFQTQQPGVGQPGLLHSSVNVEDARKGFIGVHGCREKYRWIIVWIIIGVCAVGIPVVLWIVVNRDSLGNEY